jgi:putative phage-type endonuclease
MIDRTKAISGTEVAALFGMSPYLTKFGLYARKKGLVEPIQQTPRMRMGKLLEPVVVKLFEEDTGKKVQWKDELIAHPKEPVVIGTPDGLVFWEKDMITPEPAGFEAKTAGLDRAYEWGEEGSDMVPRHYIFQCQYYMMLTGLPKWYLAALIGGNDFRKFELTADEELQALMLDEARKFVHDHLEKDVAPPVDGSEEANEALLKMYPNPKEGIREATDAEAEIIVGLTQLSKEMKFLDERKETLRNSLKQMIGFSKGLTSPYGKASWSETKESEYMVHRKAGRSLRVTGKRGEE